MMEANLEKNMTFLESFSKFFSKIISLIQDEKIKF